MFVDFWLRASSVGTMELKQNPANRQVTFFTTSAAKAPFVYETVVLTEIQFLTHSLS